MTAQAAKVEMDEDMKAPDYELRVPMDERALMERRARQLGAPLSFDEARDVYLVSPIGLTAKAMAEIVEPYREGTEAARRWEADLSERRSELNLTLAVANAVKDLPGPAAEKVDQGREPPAEVSQEERGSLMRSARIAYAKEHGMAFLAAFLQNGFMMASPNAGERHERHQQMLEKASPQELLEVAVRTGESYRKLSLQEVNERFDYATTHDETWRSKLAAAKAADRTRDANGVFKLRAEFMALDFGQQRALAPGVVTSKDAQAQMGALQRGFRAIQKAYVDKTLHMLPVTLHHKPKGELQAAPDKSVARQSAVQSVISRNRGVER